MLWSGVKNVPIPREHLPNFYESNLEPKTIMAIMQDVSKTICRLVYKMGYREP